MSDLELAFQAFDGLCTTRETLQANPQNATVIAEAHRLDTERVAALLSE